jgi:hypothetical protein
MPPDEPTQEERLEQIPEDGQTPFQPADVSHDPAADINSGGMPTRELDPTHPATDSNIQLEELYDEGVSGAAEATEPSTGDIGGYHKPEENLDTEASSE